MRIEIEKKLNGYLVRTENGAYRVTEVQWHDTPVDIENLTIDANVGIADDKAFIET